MVITKDEIAGWIRSQVSPDDDDAHLEDEDECYERYPIHEMSATGGVSRSIYANIDGMAEKLAEWLNSRD